MKVKNNMKAVLTIKSNDGKAAITVGAEKSQKLNNNEVVLFSKAIANFKKVGWLIEVKGTEKAVKAVKTETIAPKDTVTEVAPVSKEKEVVAKKVAKKVRKKRSKKISK